MFIDIDHEPFSRKWLDICYTVNEFYEREYEQACKQKDRERMIKAGTILLITQEALAKAWKDYNEEIGDGVDWEAVYKEGE